MKMQKLIVHKEWVDFTLDRRSGRMAGSICAGHGMELSISRSIVESYGGGRW